MVNDSAREQLQDRFRDVTGDLSLLIKHCRSVAGGDINEAFQVEMSDSSRFMLKMNQISDAKFFEAEKLGLQTLARTDGPRIPKVICTGVFDDDSGSYLVLEWIETGRRSSRFSEEFGQSLALLHRSGTGTQFGFDHENFIGSTPQPNSWTDDWSIFWCERRMRFQIELAHRNGFGSAFPQPKVDRFLDRVAKLLSETDERPALIHGDLWSGNYLVGQSGEPVLIDPAAYFASREAEFGMTSLFGGFDQPFYRAYQETFPLTDGHENRVEIYRLYHLLNHLNLFGSSYLSGCAAIIDRWS